MAGAEPSRDGCTGASWSGLTAGTPGYEDISSAIGIHSMLVIPAIDLKDGQCVRLRQGRMEDSTVFSDSPADMARQWQQQGARRLHLVDLNGAFAGEPVNGRAVEEIARACPDLPLQIGGGIRDLATIEQYLA